MDTQTDSGSDDISKFLSGLKSQKGADSISATPPKEKPETQPNQSTDKILQSMPKMPEPPKLHDIPTAQDQQFHSPFKDFSGPMTFLAAMGSLMTRHPAKVAMDSFSAMVNANVSGQKDVMQQARENMKAATETVIKQNEVELERYKLVMDKYKDNANEMFARLAANAAGFNDQNTLAMIKANPSAALTFFQDKQTRIDQLKKWNQEQDLKEREFADKQRHEKVMEGEGSNVEQTAQAIAEYRMPPPSPANRSPQVQAIRERVLQLNPEYDATKYAGKQAGATSGARTAGSRSANLELIQRNLEAAIPQAEEASAKVPRGKWVPLNQLVQKGQVATSDPNYREFAMANLQIAELWARAMNPTGVMREGDRDLALNMLSTATSPETYKRQISVLRGFVERERQATTEFREGKEPSIGGKAAGSQPSTGDGDKSGWSFEEVH